VPSAESKPPADLGLCDPVDAPLAALPPRRTATVQAPGKKRSKRRSSDVGGPPGVSRYWTFGGGLLLAVATYFVPIPGLFVAIPVGALSLLVLFAIIMLLGVPAMVEHPFLLLQLALFGGGIGRYTPEQIQRMATRIRRFWPVLSHAALAAAGCALAFLAGVNSPSLPPNSPFRIKPQGQRQAAQPGQPMGNRAIDRMLDLRAEQVRRAEAAFPADRDLPDPAAPQPDLQPAPARAAAPVTARPNPQWPQPAWPAPPRMLPPGVVRRPLSPVDYERFRRLQKRVSGQAVNPQAPMPATPLQRPPQPAAPPSGI